MQDGHLLALAYHADITFLAYDSGLVPDPPLLWEDLVQANAQYVLPAGEGTASADAFTVQYMAYGGSLAREDGRPFLDADIVSKVLADYARAIESGLLSRDMRSLTSLDDCWAMFLRGNAGMTAVSSWQYQRDRAKLEQVRVAQIPTPSGETLTLARAWAWGIATRNPAKHDAAVRYLLAVSRTDTMVEWCRASHHLPARPEALTDLLPEEDYRSFIEEQLRHARAYPANDHYAQLQPIITQAIDDVLSGAASPDRAAVTAAAMAMRLR